MFLNCSFVFQMTAYGDQFADKSNFFIMLVLVQCLCYVLHCLVKLQSHDLGSMNFPGIDLNGFLTYVLHLFWQLFCYDL